MKNIVLFKKGLFFYWQLFCVIVHLLLYLYSNASFQTKNYAASKSF